MGEKNISKIGFIFLMFIIMFSFNVSAEETSIRAWDFIQDTLDGEIIGENSYCMDKTCYLYEGDIFRINNQEMKIEYMTMNDLKLNIKGEIVLLEVGDNQNFYESVSFNVEKKYYTEKESEVSYITLIFKKGLGFCKTTDNPSIEDCKLYEYPIDTVEYPVNTISIFTDRIKIEDIFDGKVKLAIYDYRYPEVKEIFGFYEIGDSFEYVRIENKKYIITIDKIFYTDKETLTSYVEFSIEEVTKEIIPVKEEIDIIDIINKESNEDGNESLSIWQKIMAWFSRLF